MNFNQKLIVKFVAYVFSALFLSNASIVGAESFSGMEMPVKNMLVEYTGCPTENAENFKYSTVWAGKYTGGASERCEESGNHPGVDIPLPKGTPIYAVADGVVIKFRRTGIQGPNEGWGVHLIIKHEIPNKGIIYSIYAHLQSGSIPSAIDLNSPNNQILKGQFIGNSGNTGYTFPPGGGYHLHFQIDKDLGGNHPYWCGDPNGVPTTCTEKFTYNPIIFIQNNFPNTPPPDWVAIYRFRSATNGARCWNTKEIPPNACSDYENEIEAWIAPNKALPGTYKAVQCSYSTDHIIVEYGSSDYNELKNAGYECSVELGYPYRSDSAPSQPTQWNNTCKLWRLSYDTSDGGAHLFTRGADDTKGMTCEGARGIVFSNFECDTPDECNKDGGDGTIPAPYNLSATAQSSDSIKLEFVLPAINTTYWIRYYRDGKAINKVNPITVILDNQGLEPSTKYCYQVQTVTKDYGGSELTEEVCATTKDKTPPSPPPDITYTLAINNIGNGSGAVTDSSNDINCTSKICYIKIPAGTEVILSAIADENSIFKEWRVDGCMGQTECKITMNKDITAFVKIDLKPQAPENTAPIANDQLVELDEDATIDITLTGSDEDEDELTFTIVTQPEKGKLSGTSPNVTYTPNANYNGSDNFTFKVSDGSEESNIATVDITVKAVNDAPIANSQSISTNKNTPIDIILTSSDEDGDTVTYIITDNPDNGVLSGTAPNKTYAPNNNYTGSDSFSFMVNDGIINSNTAVISIEVKTNNTENIPSNSINILKTGQTTKYQTGDDGDLQKGVIWPEPRFTDNRDGTVIDNLTELMWLKDAKCFNTNTWSNSLITISDFNSSPDNYGCTEYSASYTDWRLPNINELHSLTDYSQTNPVIQPKSPFINIQANYYWSSTTNADDINKGWRINFYGGSIDSENKSENNYIWPVKNKKQEADSPKTSSKIYLDLEPYDIGDMPDEFGQDLVVGETKGKKYLFGYTKEPTGKIEYNNLNLSNKFEVILTADWSAFTQNILLVSDNGNQINVVFKSYNNIIFGNTKKSWSKANWRGGASSNEIKLFIDGETAKLFINDTFFGTVKIQQGKIYKQLQITGIKQKDSVFGLTAQNL